MSEKKIDLIEWQASHRFDDEETEKLFREFSNQLYILTFRLDRNGTKVISQHNGCIIFVNRDFQFEVSVGDTWICKLTPAQNCAYATPLIKITLNDVLNFNEQLRENVLRVLWQKHGSDLKVIFENRYKNEIQSKIAEELKTDYEEKINRISKEKEEIEDELHQTRFQLKSQETSSPVDLDEFIFLGTDDIITKSDPNVNLPKSSEFKSNVVAESNPIRSTDGSPAPVSQISAPQIKRTGAVTQKYEVTRIGPDTISSPSFTDNKYFVHISPDYKLLLIRPDEDGDVYCINKTIRLKDLGLVSGFTNRKFLVAEYNEQYRGMLVRL